MQPDPSPQFWTALDELVAASNLVIDRPRGGAHPRFSDLVYPLDYGHLEATRAGDGGEIDVWIGAEPSQRVTACAVTVDLLKRDSEIKVLLGCTADDIETVRGFHDSGPMRVAVLVR
jgi:inorganic pyrophosphatase